MGDALKRVPGITMQNDQDNGQRISATLGGGYNPIREKAAYTGAFGVSALPFRK